MVCREDKLASVAMALVKRDVGLDDAQVQSLMHQLRHEGMGQLADSLHREQARWELRMRLQGEIAADPTLRPQRRAGLLDRLDRATEQGAGGSSDEQNADGTAEGSTLHAVEQLRARANLAEHRLGQRLREVASRSGSTLSEIRERFVQLRAKAPPGRKPRASSGEREQLAGLPQDPATRQALAQLHGLPGQPRPVVTDWSEVPGAAWPHVGYHGDSGRLEVRDRDGTPLAFRGVPAEVAAQLRDPVQADQARAEVVAEPAYRYPSLTDAAAAGLAVRCEQCGQFVGDPHTCPVDRVTRLEGELGVLRTADGLVLGRLTDPKLVRQALQGSPAVRVQLLLRVPGRASWARSPAAEPLAVADAGPPPGAGPGTVRGELLVQAGPDGVPQLRTSELGCDCAACRRTGRCRHTAVAQRVALAQLTEPGDRPGAAVVLELPAPAPALPALPPDLSTLRFAQDSEAFADVVRQALVDADENPSDPVPLILDGPALYGYGEQRRFGVEVEYVVDEARVISYGDQAGDGRLALTTITEQDYVWGEVTEQEWDEAKGGYVTRTSPGWVEQDVEVPSLDGEEPLDDHQLASARIGQALHEAHLLVDPAQLEYGAAKNDGYTSPAWSLEKDASVSGELVSPVLADRLEDWQQLRDVCAVVVNNGGTARRASAHVHVSAPEYASDGRYPTRLLRLVAEYDDDLHRMAHTPGSERDLAQWATPNLPTPTLGHLDISEVHGRHGRYAAVNFDEVGQADEPDDDHIEFRLFDASLQPGRMQAQVKLATALTDYAVRHREQPAGPRRPVGTAVRQAAEQGQPGLQLAHPDQVDEHTWAQATEPVRDLIDRLFRRDVDKRQIAALWAVGRYRATL